MSVGNPTRAQWRGREQRIPSLRASLRRYIELLQMISSAMLKTRYRGSILGVYWSLSNPLMMTGVYTLVLGSAFAKYYDNSLAAYALATFTGLAVLNIFSNTTGQALTSIVSNGTLLNKVRLPFSVFPVAVVASNGYQYFVGTFPVLVAIALSTTHSPLNAVAILVPSFALFLVTIGFSLLTASLYVFFRDLPYIYEITVFLVWITSPIFYPASLVPHRVAPFLAFNPIVAIVASLRQIALSPGLPDVHLMELSVLSGCMCLSVGLAAFATLRRKFMDLL